MLEFAKQQSPGLGLAHIKDYPDSKVHGANMGPSWGRQDPGGLHDGHMNFAIWVSNNSTANPQSQDKPLTYMEEQCQG